MFWCSFPERCLGQICSHFVTVCCSDAPSYHRSQSDANGAQTNVAPGVTTPPPRLGLTRTHLQHNLVNIITTIAAVASRPQRWQQPRSWKHMWRGRRLTDNNGSREYQPKERQFIIETTPNNGDATLKKEESASGQASKPMEPTDQPAWSRTSQRKEPIEASE